MLPSPWVGLVLALAAYRLVRLVGWDDFPLVQGLRNRLIGASFRDGELSGLRRPTLAHFFGCPFCQGFWVSLAVYVAWLEEPRPTLYVLAPFALSGFVGLIAKNLDA